MSLTISIHALEDAGIDDRWNALCRQSPQRSPFSKTSYLRASAAAAEGLHVRVHLVEDGGQDVAGCALHWRRRGPYREVVLPAFTPYSAFLLRDLTSESDVHYRRSPFERLVESIEESYHAVRIQLPPGVDDVRPAIWRGWSARPFYTYDRKLNPSANLTDAWSSSTAGAYHKYREEYEVVNADIATCVSLCADSYGRSGRRLPLASDRLHGFIGRLKTGGAVALYGVRNTFSREIEATVIVPRDDLAAYYWMAGSLPGPAMTVLIGELLQILAEDGVERFDFVGANTPSIAEFKRKFGCSLQQYQGITFFARKELRLLDTLVQILR